MFVYLLTAVFFDLRTYKIPNFVHYFFLMARLPFFWPEGIASILPSVVGLILPIAVLFPLFIIRGIGAGDIKICSVVCCYFGYGIVWRLLWITLCISAVLAVIKIIFGVLKKEERRFLFSFAKINNFDEIPDSHKIHMSVAICIASVICIGGVVY